MSTARTLDHVSDVITRSISDEALELAGDMSVGAQVVFTSLPC
ncbi:hypothetical protein KQR54_09060 [Mycobacterium gordonae]|nr:hypothetical protein [Mycobacterium gordonae]MCQ4361292.1 hypothetical protein [Mycobacterium gordonae]